MNRAALCCRDVRVQAFTTADNKTLIGKRTYSANKKEKEHDAGDGGNIASAFVSGQCIDAHALEADTPQAVAPRKSNASKKRKGVPTPAAKKKAAAKRGSTGWDPQSRVTFDI